MTDPERDHTTEPAEGAEQPGTDDGDGRTPRPEEPAEGGDVGEPGADRTCAHADLCTPAGAPTPARDEPW